MKTFLNLSVSLAGLLALAAAGCHSEQTGSPYHPGPVAGNVVGEGVGIVAGNAVGFGAGIVNGTVEGTRRVLDTQYRMVRYWRTETTSDGRTIQVPYDVMVDDYGRPVVMPAPTGRPAPRHVSTNAPAQK
jgi:hypothetical protein